MSSKIPLFLGVWVVAGMGSCFGQVPATVKDGCSSDIVLTRATKDFRDAEVALNKGHKTQADELFESALSVLGDLYINEAAINDSPQRLMIARLNQELGELDQSLSLKKSVAKSRLMMYARKLGCEDQI